MDWFDAIGDLFNEGGNWSGVSDAASNAASSTGDVAFSVASPVVDNWADTALSSSPNNWADTGLNTAGNNWADSNIPSWAGADNWADTGSPVLGVDQSASYSPNAYDGSNQTQISGFNVDPTKVPDYANTPVGGNVGTTANVGNSYDGNQRTFKPGGMIASSGDSTPSSQYPGSPQGSDWLSNAGQKVGDWFDKNGTNAGLKLGAQAIGSLARAPGSAQLNSYLKDVQAQEAATQALNQSMATKKAGIGDSLAADAAAMSPTQTAMNSQNAAKNRDSAQWAEQKASMQAHGYDQNAIDAEERRSSIGGSQNQGTAFDSGYASGVQAQNNTYGTAGSMYGQVAQPTAGLSTAWQGLSNANANAQKAAGSGVEQAFNVVNSTQPKANNGTSLNNTQ